MNETRHRDEDGTPTGASSGRRRYRHEAVLYASEEELLDVVVPFLQEGVAAGEPSLVTVRTTTAALVRAAVGDAAGVTYLGERYDRPASVVISSREIFAAHLADRASQIRVVSEVPHPGLGARWDGWARYEAVINHAYAEFPLWGLCTYDTRITPDRVLDDVTRTHPHLTTADDRGDNPRYQDPVEFLTRRPPAEPDPLETASPPVIELTDPTPAAARQAVRSAATARPASPGSDTPSPGASRVATPRSATPPLRRPELTTSDVDHLVLAVSEAITNALVHGRPPVRFRLWTAPDRIVATVSDHGNGPPDPFAGLLPVTDTASPGLGLWLTHQLCDHVTLDTTGDGFTIRLVAGTPHPGRSNHAPDHP